jgi:hypothetical protein
MISLGLNVRSAFRTMNPRSALLAAVLAVGLHGCWRGETGPRTLWLNVPVDGVLTLEETAPPPF